MAIPPENIAIFLQKFIVTAPVAAAFTANYNSVGVVTTNQQAKRQWHLYLPGPV